MSCIKGGSMRFLSKIDSGLWDCDCANTRAHHDLCRYYNIDLEELSVAEIKVLIEDKKITNQDVVEFYNNEWWDEQP